MLKLLLAFGIAFQVPVATYLTIKSGIKTKEELIELNNKTTIKTFLIGESLLKNLDKNSIFSVL